MLTTSTNGSPRGRNISLQNKGSGCGKRTLKFRPSTVDENHGSGQPRLLAATRMDMGMAEEIDKALLAHGEWKKRLALIIEKGDKDLSPEAVAKDDQCEFGRWLYLEIAPEARTQLIYEKARKLHADFHVEAGRVLALALSGRRLEAMEAIETASDFTCLSGALAFALGQWRFRLAKAPSGPAAG